LAPGHLITTLTYDGQLPGPLLRATVGQQMRVDVYNETDSAERIHWHGQDTALDAAAYVPAHSMRRMEFTPARPGLFFYHSHVIAAANLDAGLYSGQAGGLLVERRTRPGENKSGHYDREWVVVLKECEPFIRRTRRGCEIGYRSFTLNGRVPGYGAPVRLNSGERVLLHVLNASATELRSLALPGHSFEVTALDGNPVPSPARVSTLQVSPAERISAIVQTQADTPSPAEWIVRDPGAEGWDYTRFGSGRACEPDAILDMVLTRHDAARSGFNSWSVNGGSFSAAEPRPLFRLRRGLRYRLRICNTSDEVLPLHLQRHRLEIVRIGGKPTAGVLKDVVTLGPCQQVEVDFVADSRGSALFYCTRQLHRDFGLMALVDYT
jgi:FtsP/CotA-like multicopper oxidase with cupredoxin domain